MNKIEQAARQALEYLECTKTVFTEDEELDEAITALREALAEQAEQEPVGVVNPNGNVNWRVGQEQLPPRTKLYAAPVRTKDLTEPLIDELRECRDLLMCVESCSRNNFENLAYERVQAIDAVIAVDREKNK